jgi:hypothetical protein
MVKGKRPSPSDSSVPMRESGDDPDASWTARSRTLAAAGVLPAEISRRRGRPPLPAGKGKRHALGIRTTKELSELLHQAAEASGRSVAQEVEIRLERSFDHDRVVEILVLQNGQLADVLVALAMNRAKAAGPASEAEIQAITEFGDILRQINEGLEVIRKPLGVRRKAKRGADSK